LSTLAISLAALVAVAFLAARPKLGIALVFIVRPLVDTTWDVQVVGGLKLTELFSVAVPAVILLQIMFASGGQGISKMPVRWPWILWVTDVFIFSALIMFESGLQDGTNVLFRHLNGLAGFYMLQANYTTREEAARFGWVLIVASAVPIAMGVVEGLTGHHWRVTYGDNGVIRNTGLYHDVITIRYYALQGIIGAFMVANFGKATGTPSRMLLVAYALGALFVVKGAYSKSGVLIVAAWAFLWPFLLRQYKTLVAALFLGLLAALYFSQQIMDGIGFIFSKELAALSGSGNVQHTFEGRWYIWDEAFAAWQQLGIAHKIFGSGHEGLGLHNDFLQILVHGGIVGLTLYVVLLVGIGSRVVRAVAVRRDACATGAVMLFIMWIVDAIGLVPSAYSGYQWFVWGCLALFLRLGELAPAPGQVAADAAPLRRPANLMA
jgi:O-antigen ligase